MMCAKNTLQQKRERIIKNVSYSKTEIVGSTSTYSPILSLFIFIVTNHHAFYYSSMLL